MCFSVSLFRCWRDVRHKNYIADHLDHNIRGVRRTTTGRYRTDAAFLVERPNAQTIVAVHLPFLKSRSGLVGVRCAHRVRLCGTGERSGRWHDGVPPRLTDRWKNHDRWIRPLRTHFRGAQLEEGFWTWHE